ncbi:MAG TPA: O-antigen ligase family protein [Puia sp.]
MKRLFTIKENLTDKITYYHLALFLISLPFDSLYTRVILLSLVIHTAVHFKKEQLKKFNHKYIFFLATLYFVTLVCTIYTIDINEALSYLTQELAILLFPVIFVLTTLNISKYKNQLLTFFSATCLITVIFLYINALQIIHFYHLPVSFLFSDSFLNHHFTEPIQLHATYFSMYVALALFCLLQKSLNQTVLLKKIVLIICVLILLAALIQLASRSVFIALILTVCIAFPLLSFNKKSRFSFVIACTLLLTGILTVAFTNDFLKRRYLDELKNDLGVTASNEGRTVRWEAIGEVILKKPFIGYGTGSEKHVLKEEYLDKKLYTSYSLEMNTHNQYLGYLLRAGIFGLMIYLLTLGFGFYTAIKYRDILFLGFMIIIGITSVSENILEINKGIFFYSFFFSFFVLSNDKLLLEEKFNNPILNV